MGRYYPIYLDIAERRCVVIGAGQVAERKVQQLLAAGADVTLVSPDATKELQRLADEGSLRWIRRHYVRGDIAGAFLAIAATDDTNVNRQVHAEAERERALLNVVDVPSLCTFIAPAIVERGPVTAAISTSGTSPALARKIRELMDGTQRHGESDEDAYCRCLSWADAAGVLAEVRSELKARHQTASPDAWQAAMDEQTLALVRAGDAQAAKERLLQSLMGSGSRK